MGRPLPKSVLEWLEKNIWKYPNVKGFSRSFKRKIVGGEETEIECVRIYVSKKLPRSHLLDEEVIPLTIEDIPTDVVEKGVPKALGLDKTDLFRPVIMGVSVGNKAITAGTIGALFKKGGEIYVGSNAHVLTPNPSKPPEKVRPREILQPGPYHIREKGWNVNDPKFVVGRYVWHERIKPVYEPSNCGVASLLAKTYNSLAKLFGRRTRLVSLVEEYNVIDFSVYEPIEEHRYEYPDIDVEGAKFIGLLFAGSKYLGIVCKEKYIREAGYEVVDHESYEPKLFDKVYGTSFWCHYETVVEDDSAEVEVSYGDFTARFRDVIFLRNEPAGTIRGGWSGSAWWFKEDGG